MTVDIDGGRFRILCIPGGFDSSPVFVYSWWIGFDSSPVFCVFMVDRVTEDREMAMEQRRLGFQNPMSERTDLNQIGTISVFNQNFNSCFAPFNFTICQKTTLFAF